MKVQAQNKSGNKLALRVFFKPGKDCNVSFPKSFVKDIFFGKDQKTLIHFIKVDPTKSWGEFEVSIEPRELNVTGTPVV